MDKRRKTRKQDCEDLQRKFYPRKKQVQCRNCDKFGHVTSHCNENKEAPENIDIGGQLPTRHQQAPARIVQVASLQSKTNGVFVDGVIDGKLRALLWDTGATKTIIRPDIVKPSTRIVPTKWRLRTATRDPATIHGEANVSFVIGSTSLQQLVLVADIEDELILGMDIMNMKAFLIGKMRKPYVWF